MKNATWLAVLIMMILAALSAVACGSSSSSSSNPAVDDDTMPADDDASPDDDDDDNDDDNDASPGSGTKDPIVLMHGFAGWGDSGFAPLAYFSSVVEDLTKLGYTVYEPAVSPINSMDTRAHQWAEAIDAHFGANAKVNIIAHSQGGLDARYLISTMGWGNRVGALVMVSAPNRGTAIADIAADLVPGFGQDIVNWILQLFGMNWDGITECTHDYVTNTFNPANPDDPRVAYYSYAADASENCFLLLEPTHFIIDLMDGPNDGVVDDASAKWGTELGIESTDHWGLIGQPLGLTKFDFRDFYRDIALFLRDNGF